MLIRVDTTTGIVRFLHPEDVTGICANEPDGDECLVTMRNGKEYLIQDSALDFAERINDLIKRTSHCVAPTAEVSGTESHKQICDPEKAGDAFIDMFATLLSEASPILEECKKLLKADKPIQPVTLAWVLRDIDDLLSARSVAMNRLAEAVNRLSEGAK